MKALFLVFYGFQEYNGISKKSDTKYQLLKNVEWMSVPAITK